MDYLSNLFMINFYWKIWMIIFNEIFLINFLFIRLKFEISLKEINITQIWTRIFRIYLFKFKYN